MEPLSEEVILGKLIENWSYSKEREKNIIITDQMSIDILSFKGKIILKEIKKSSKALEAAKAQTLFYAYVLRKKGINVDEIWIMIPKERKVEKFKVDEKSLKWIEQVLKDIDTITNKQYPPPPKKNKYCRSCAFRMLCWA